MSGKADRYQYLKRVLCGHRVNKALLVCKRRELGLIQSVMFPAMTSSLGDTSRGSGISRPTEMWALRRIEGFEVQKIERQIEALEVIVSAVDKALEQLDDDEYLAYELWYAQRKKLTYMQIFRKMHMSKSNAYRVRDKMLSKVEGFLQSINLGSLWEVSL